MQKQEYILANARRWIFKAAIVLLAHLNSTPSGYVEETGEYLQFDWDPAAAIKLEHQPWLIYLKWRGSV